jgi:lipopolysaccharide transport system ATP-binding protein
MRKKEIQRKLDEIIDFSGVDRYIDTPVKRYSSGMYVRLAFAVAAHLENEILIVDEVLAVGDAEFQRKCLGKMESVSKGEGRTVLFVSHNMTAIANLCNFLCTLNNGTIDFIGDVNVGIERYYRRSLKNSGNPNDSGSNLQQLPKDEDFELLAITVFQEDGEGTEFFTNQRICIKFTYNVTRKITGLRIGFDLLENLTETTLFRTFHDDQSDSIIHEKGCYTLIGSIPANLLKQGGYSINIVIGIHNVRWISIEQITLPINIHNINGINSQYADQRPGVIMPLIKWEVK